MGFFQESAIFQVYRATNCADLLVEMEGLLKNWKERVAEAAGVLLAAPEVVEKIDVFFQKHVLPACCGLPVGDVGREWQRTSSPFARLFVHFVFSEAMEIVSEVENINPYLVTPHADWLRVGESVKSADPGGRTVCDDFQIQETSKWGALDLETLFSSFLGGVFVFQICSLSCPWCCATFTATSRGRP